MKRGGPLKRSPMPRGTSVLKATKPLARTSTLKQKSPIERGQSQLARAKAPMRARSRTNADPRPKTGEAELCRGQACYLAIPGVCQNARETVVPAHSNQARHGKGRGIKAHDEFTVPACFHCHAELDQGKRFTREEKFAMWDVAFEKWRQKRNEISCAEPSSE